tara:strand:- start:242 stop:370 length:129 start_codon:yes stop_codon:yes gene_type:complete
MVTNSGIYMYLYGNGGGFNAKDGASKNFCKAYLKYQYAVTRE